MLPRLPPQLLFASALLVLASACSDAADGTGRGSASGVNPSGTLGALSEAQRRQLCDFTQNNLHAGTTLQCSGGYTVTTGNYDRKGVDQCARRLDQFPSDCTATVNHAEQCALVTDGDPCDSEASAAACETIVECGNRI
ncbi:MAG: hypothetical protein HRU17_15765 [Polyangiaceae bacterium]|nr:hypothetical protein [Polyangiaceae bacterium]